MLHADKLASGMVGAEVEFFFSDEWEPLIKTAVFIAGNEKRVVFETEWRDNICTIPHECLAKPDVHLMAGVYGTNSGGSLVIPTVYADLGIIWPGADADGETGAEASPELWAQLKAQFDLAEKTENKVSVLSSAATDIQYPSAKAVYDAIAASRDVVTIEGTASDDLDAVAITTQNAFQLVAEAWNDARRPLVMLRLSETIYAYLYAFTAEEPAMALFSLPASKVLNSSPPYTIILFENNEAVILNALDSHISDTSTAAVQNKVVKEYVDDKASGKEDKANKISAITADSTDAQYPSAKAVRDYVAANSGGGGSGSNTVTIYIQSDIIAGQWSEEPPITMPKGSTWADFCIKNPYGPELELAYSSSYVRMLNVGGGYAEYFEDCRHTVRCGGLDRLIDGKTYYLYGA